MNNENILSKIFVLVTAVTGYYSTNFSSNRNLENVQFKQFVAMQVYSELSI